MMMANITVQTPTAVSAVLRATQYTNNYVRVKLNVQKEILVSSRKNKHVNN